MILLLDFRHQDFYSICKLNVDIIFFENTDKLFEIRTERNSPSEEILRLSRDFLRSIYPDLQSAIKFLLLSLDQSFDRVHVECCRIAPLPIVKPVFF